VASGPITEVQKLLLEDNRLVIDIYNALHGITGPYYVDETVPVYGVRSSQFMDVPSVTRLVFDLNGAAEYSVALSADRTQLTVSFSENEMTNVSFNSNGLTDSITINGTGIPLVQVYPAYNPDRYVISVNNASTDIIRTDSVNGAYVSQMNVFQSIGSGVQIDAFVRGSWPSYDIVENGNSVTVNFFANTLTGLEYNYMTREIRLAKTAQFDINSVRHEDDYTHGRYTLTFPVDAQAAWGRGELNINDNYIDSLRLETNAGRTQLIISESRVLVFTVQDAGDAYIVKAHLPRDIYDNIVVIDPGHGGSHPGSTSQSIEEKEIDLAISQKLMTLFESDTNIKAYATRVDDSLTIEPEARPPWANALGDMFVSIHCNAVERNSVANGTEVYWYPHDNDSYLGFSSERFAGIINERLKAMLPQISNRGLRTDMLTVLHYTTIPAVLCELGFLTNANDAALLSDDSFQWQIAWALYYGIQDAFNVYRPYRGTILW
jgi:N-acetylmuramoyl-L-alanine amidase